MKYQRLIPASAEEQSSLAVHLSAIVFWCTVWIGLLGAFVLLRGLEQGIHDRYHATADHVAHEVDGLLDHGPDRLVHRLHALAGELNTLDVRGLTVRLGNETLRVGDTRDEHSVLVRRVKYLSPAAGGQAQTAEVGVFLPSSDVLVAAKRRDTLALLGGTLLAFALALQWLLRWAITRPFEQMIHTARVFTAGDLTRRFDEQRKDEFGFLAQFINRALDYSLEQQRELRIALERAQASESALFTEKERIEITLHSIGDGVITTDAAGCVRYLNPAAEKLTGWTVDGVRGRPLGSILRLVDEVSRQPLDNPVERCLRDGTVIGNTEHVTLVRDDGQEIDISHSAAPIRNRGDGHVGAVMVFHDVGHARRLARQLSYQASHDGLTGLYNRSEFEKRLHRLLDTAGDDPRGHAMCYLDMDQFKVVNDTCGHAAGDELLRRVAELLRDHLRDTDTVARLGGDEFGLLIIHCDAAHAQQLMEQLIARIRAFRFAWGEHSFDVGVSIGMVHIPSGEHTVADVLSAADVACYAAKEAGRNRLHVYHHDDDELRRRRADMHWVSRLNRAISDNRFCLYTQPVAPLAGGGGDPGYHEVLVRLLDEQGRLVPPNAFIPAAERYNLMPHIDRWVIATLCGALTARADNHMRFAINLSGQSLCDAEFLGFVVTQLDRGCIDPGRLCFEITETAAISHLDRATLFIDTLRGRGCRFALDDFGSGLSSFAYLKNLRVDYLKIDGRFVRDSAENPIDRAMVAAIHNVGEAMGIRTIAEFVETPAIITVLEEIGVHFAQGYGIARPAPIDELFATSPAATRSARA